MRTGTSFWPFLSLRFYLEYPLFVVEILMEDIAFSVSLQLCNFKATIPKWVG